MKIREYESYMHCVVCGCSLRGRAYRYPHGCYGGKYCLKHADEVNPTLAMKRFNLQQPETREDIIRRFRSGEKPVKIAEKYMVSQNTIRDVIRREEDGK